MPQEVLATDGEWVRSEARVANIAERVVPAADHAGLRWFQSDLLVPNSDAEASDRKYREDFVNRLLVLGRTNLVRDPLVINPLPIEWL